MAIIEDRIHWRDRAERLLNEYDIPYVIFSGNFEELIDKVNGGGAHITPSSSHVEITQEEVAVTREVATATPMRREEATVKEKPLAVEINIPKQEVVHEPKEIIREVPKYIEKQVIKEVPKYIDREVIKEVPVEVEKIVENTVVKTEVVEVKPNFDNINIDFQLPSISPKIPESIELVRNNQPEDGPQLIGIMSIEKDADISNSVLLIANSLAVLGYSPLLIAPGREEIEMVEQLAFANEKGGDDDDIEVFEHEGVHYMRNSTEWEYSDLMTSHYSHIIFWYGSLEQYYQSHYSDWSRTDIPLLITSGSRWKIDHIQSIIEQLSPSTLQRTQVLLQQGQIHFYKDLLEEFENLQMSEIPLSNNPFSPGPQVIKWASSLFSLKRRRNFHGKLWLILLMALLISAAAIWVGLQFPSPVEGG
ncbi:hypothetical protein [Bacillus sp. FSL K6-6540]|uniref:hypothetical protein n=1 Tax=Bacillus sp. FSL K6-6540 TaxID=2921512 RepID=UPI0030FC3686